MIGNHTTLLQQGALLALDLQAGNGTRDWYNGLVGG